MSHYDDDWESKLAAEATGCMVAIIWAAIAAPIALLWKSSRTPAEEQVLRGKPASYFDHTIRGIRCPACGTTNEEGKWHCYMCGRRLPPVGGP